MMGHLQHAYISSSAQLLNRLDMMGYSTITLWVKDAGDDGVIAQVHCGLNVLDMMGYSTITLWVKYAGDDEL